jgi:hypothetical protein
MSTATKFEIHTHDQGVIRGDFENLEAAAGVRGWNVIGVKTARSIALRPEIEGAPMFDALCGPMYGGPGIVRYEDSKTNDQLSR